MHSSINTKALEKSKFLHLSWSPNAGSSQWDGEPDELQKSHRGDGIDKCSFCIAAERSLVPWKKSGGVGCGLEEWIHRRWSSNSVMGPGWADIKWISCRGSCRNMFLSNLAAQNIAPCAYMWSTYSFIKFVKKLCLIYLCQCQYQKIKIDEFIFHSTWHSSKF